MLLSPQNHHRLLRKKRLLLQNSIHFPVKTPIKKSVPGKFLLLYKYIVLSFPDPSLRSMQWQQLQLRYLLLHHLRLLCFLFKTASSFSGEAAPKLEYLLDIVNTGTHKEMDMCFELTNKHCHVVIYSPEKNEVVALFSIRQTRYRLIWLWTIAKNCSRISLPIYRPGWKSMTKTDSW